MDEALMDRIHKVAMNTCRILYICADLLDPQRSSISKGYLKKLKERAQELNKKAQELP